ncbi:hypothetical protein [Lacipirellula limnantheis]|uniref:Beta-hexosaminidase bacterial type N-terminal domain-containing protein n=1 Tax=Lacipirellula limnantheis TaxID=2528024 RepID=A0A517U6R3_9BACT|nr:hypothetical protein [Lacipirellula limnantheis]QDT76293.1 hypothetical protein I41_55430 [Lacipirellula limnantheis]
MAIGVTNQVRVRQRAFMAAWAISWLWLAGLAWGDAADANADQSVGIDLTSAKVFAPADLTGPETKAVHLLVDEIAARTRLRLEIVRDWPQDEQQAVIAVGQAKALAAHATVADERASSGTLPAEGFRIVTETSAGRSPTIFVLGNDERGVLFGVGKLLRSLEMTRDRLALRAPLEVTAAPAMPIRGHQLGYRPKTNSYDGWDLPQWEQYLRDLTVFGCNTIELIPPRSDDDADSPHFPRPPLEMMVGMSQLADDYGLDVSLWYPAMDASYATEAEIAAGLAEWRGVLSKLPRVDAIFLPFGDPGEAPPEQLVALLQRQAVQLEELHAGAQVWVSLQGLTQPQFDDLIDFLRTDPTWLTGVVHGPQTRVSVAKLRELLPRRLAIRGYPDITHSMRCEYPVPDWDVAYAMTEGREIINPRPLDETTIFKQYRDHAVGVVTYSEGCNDDLNKMIWSQLCWDPAARPIDSLQDYGRYFIGSDQGSDFALGLLALEQNWRGPLLTNGTVLTTLQQFQAIEQAAPPALRQNWRFQQALYRAYYDAYQQARLVEETAQEAAAMEALIQAEALGAEGALARAEAILARAEAPAPHDALAARVKELAEALFQSIRMQLSVAKYGAIDVNRGANLDELDVPLNNRRWLRRKFAAIRALSSEQAKLEAIGEILHWTDPGPGGFYDDLGNPVAQPHLVRDDFYPVDPGFLSHPTLGFRSDPRWRRSWCTHVDGLYATPVTMHYDNLDPHARYKVRVVYAGESFDVAVKLSAVASDDSSAPTEREIEIHPFRPKPQPVAPVEFDVPAAATAGGELTLRWQSNPERGGPGRGCQIAEVWLLRADEP